jgi:hypothetical protein
VAETSRSEARRAQWFAQRRVFVLTAAIGKERERARARALCLTVALLAVLPETGVAQSADATAGATRPPARIANHYNHKAYQPTTGQVCEGANSAGVDCSSRAGMEAATKLDSIRQQLDRLAKEYPPVPSSGASGGER